MPQSLRVKPGEKHSVWEIQSIDELDCEVTVFDGAYMTCDMAKEEIYEEIEIYKDYDI